MKREMTAAVLAALMCLSGCAQQEDPYKVDTVIRIPVDPAGETAVQTEFATENSMETEPVAPTLETAAPTEKPSSGGEDSGNKGGSSREDGSDGEPQKQTQPEETAEVTEAPATELPETQPPEPETTETQPPQETENSLYDISGYSVGTLEYAMADEINAGRREEGMAEFRMDSRLCAIASCRAYEICQVWSHTRPDGRSYTTVLSDYGYSAGAVTELLVYVTGDGDASALVAKWMESETHRASLLGGYSVIGIGVYRANGFTYVCCLLAG